MHTVHDATALVENDGERQVRTLDQPNVLDNARGRRDRRIVKVSMVLAELRYLCRIDARYGKRRAQVDEATNVPGIDIAFSLSQMVLRSNAGHDRLACAGAHGPRSPRSMITFTISENVRARRVSSIKASCEV